MMLFLENRSLRQSVNASGFSGSSADLRSSNFVVSQHLHLRYREALSGLSIADSSLWIKRRESSPEVARWNLPQINEEPSENSPYFSSENRLKPVPAIGKSRRNPLGIKV
jgi:hypothetical protein